MDNTLHLSADAQGQFGANAQHSLFVLSSNRLGCAMAGVQGPPGRLASAAAAKNGPPESRLLTWAESKSPTTLISRLAGCSRDMTASWVGPSCSCSISAGSRDWNRLHQQAWERGSCCKLSRLAALLSEQANG